MIKKTFRSKILVFSLIFSFILLIATEAAPNKVNFNSDEEFKPVVRVKEGGEQIPAAQKERFERLLEEGKKLFQEEMDYEGAIEKFKEAQALAVTREQKSDVYFYLSLAYYATLKEKGKEEFIEITRKLIEIDYYRELDRLLCPPKYIELFQGIKKEYGALKIQSRPAGADVYLYDSKDPVGKTPLTIGSKAGAVKIRVKKGKREKKDTLKVIAGEKTTSPIYVLKGRSGLIYVLGGIVVAGGVGAALLLKGKPSEGGVTGPTTGSIQVNSTPTGASVYLDGSDTGKTTNTTLTNVSPGNHTVKLIKEGYEDYEESITVTAGQTVTVSANLTVIISGGYKFITKWGSQGSGDGQFDKLEGIAVDGAGYVYVADTENHRVQKFTSGGMFVAKWGSQGSGNGQLGSPYHVAVDGASYVYVTDPGNSRIQKFTSSGTFVIKWGSQGSGDGQFDSPRGIAIDSSGYVYVIDNKNYRIQKFTSDGTFVTKWGSKGSGDDQFLFPQGISADGAGYVYVADAGNNRIQKFTSSGNFVTKWGSEGSGDGQFNSPRDISADEAGYVYVADSSNHRIQKFTSGGTFVTKWGSEGSGDGQFTEPWGIAVDRDGYVYVTDRENHRIQKFGPASVIQKASKNTYSPFKNHFLNRNLRPRPSLLKPPGLNRLEKKQTLMNKKVRRNEKR